MRNGTWALVLAAVWAGAAGAQDAAPVRGQGWSVLSGKTVGSDATVVAVEAGWPGIDVGVLHGISPRADLGGKLTLNYGVEGVPGSTVLGLKLQGQGRFTLLDNGRLNLALSIAPGVLFYFYYSTVVGLTIPIDLVLGLPVSDALTVHLGISMPLWVTFGTLGTVTVPILFGGGIEYFLSRDLALTFDVKLGPSITARTSASIAFNALVGVAFKL